MLDFSSASNLLARTIYNYYIITPQYIIVRCLFNKSVSGYLKETASQKKKRVISGPTSPRRVDVSSVAYFKIHPTISQLYLRRARNTIGIARISVAGAGAADGTDPAKDTLTRDDYAISPGAIKGAGGRLGESIRPRQNHLTDRLAG